MQGGDVFVAMALLHQVVFQLCHELRHWEVQVHVTCGIKGNAEIFVMQRHAKTQGVRGREHGVGAMAQGP